MALGDRQQKPVRLTADQADRLERVCREGGRSQQAFVQAAILRALEEAETDRPPRRTKYEPGGGTDAPTGLGIVPRRPRDAEPVPVSVPPAAPAQQGQVVFNVGGASVPSSAQDGGGDLIGRLALFVVNGAEYSRDERLRTAVDVLRGCSANKEEELTLAGLLDLAVAKRLGQEKQSSTAGVMRFAFDKLKDILG